MASAAHLLSFSLLLLLLPFSPTAQTHSNISLGTSLTATLNNGSSWTSPSGEFSFGFQHLGKGEGGGFLLAIWFTKIEEKTIVWAANRNNLLEVGSKVELTVNGSLLLTDPKGNLVWTAKPTSNGASYAAMLDSGNLVVAKINSLVIWQSFDEPTDTILPTQTLKEGGRLMASYSKEKYSNGRFLLMLQNGNLELQTARFPMESSNYGYWSTKTEGRGLKLIFSQSGHMYLEGENGSTVADVYKSTVSLSSRDFYQRAILEYDGVFRYCVYPKSSSSGTGSWPKAWSSLFLVPQDICTSITAETGSGVCGFNSYCKLRDDRRPSCLCPPGYSLLDSSDDAAMAGCKQEFASQNCENGSAEMDQFQLVEMKNTDWPLSDYEYFPEVDEGWCKNACLVDCFCSVSIFRDGHCWKKKMPLSNGRVDASVGGKALIKVRRGE